ncbi:hypothetical protein M404DRAFT_1002234 [Pisolithus tinctorius Marx 270]|uniref:Clp1-like protein n=2 Tax=Pisolithus TaxID=37467 RepID=A0A0C3J0K3_PISTI|nr:hypothetical protein M404DRAFT_1002234 [Pisolithus tinctorius Marx 270]
MFQVRPAHPIQTKAIWDEDLPTTPSAMASFPAQPSYPSNIQLPRTLQRPPYAEVPRQNVLAVAPELGDVAIEYVRRGLRVQANQMLAGISALSPSHLPPAMPRSQLYHTTSLTIPFRATQHAISCPTHILALSKPSSNDATVTLVPTHAVVLASQCASLPRLPPSYVPTQPGATVSVTLPVLPISVPSPSAFAPLHAFLYTHSVSNLLSALLPAIPSSFLSTLTSHQALRGTLASGPALHSLSAHLMSSAPGLGALTGVAQKIAAVWRNAVALGVHDPELWDCLDLAWEVVIGAMNLGAGAH